MADDEMIFRQPMK